MGHDSRAGLPAGSPAGSPAADVVLTGGRVHTVDARDRVAEAVAVCGGRIARVGTSAEVGALAGPRTRVVRLEGRSVLPGINDSHLHGVWLGAMWPRLLMDGLTGGGPPQPDAPPEPPPAVRLETAEDRRRAILRTGKLLSELGITSYTEPGLGPGEDGGATGCFGSAALRDYADLAAKGELNARVTALMLFGELDGASSEAAFLKGLRSFVPPRDVPGRFRVAGVKIFADGIPPMRTAWTDRPYTGGGGHGSLLVDGASDGEREAALRAMIGAAHAAGHQVAVHATGDRTTRVTVDAFADARGRDGRDGRHYLIHGDLLSPATLAAMAASGTGLNTQAGIAVATAPMLAGALGEAALADAWPTRDALAAGVRLCLSSDAPVLTPDWRAGVAAAVTRRGLDGSVRGAAQTLSLVQALRAYTIDPARQDGAESWKGSLEPGKAADLCVLDGDLLDVAPDDLPSVPVVLTMVGGRVVHERSAGSVREH
ncbi:MULTISPECIES: amidohydrolase [Actinomadura]|uniref:Amidohydrolase n=1 Tax=Actinomadura yumaensis TaxID=111807 RepID=A0ABW2CW24_9ACTN|nr:amidohydrolase family protein [Actinomadura sp. J1-007]MWK39695.1 amidohydrolase family protein [Actinomadura sp. J1-007]